jgi:hypothetical protein
MSTRNEESKNQEHPQGPPEYEILLDLGNNLCIARVAIDDLREQDINAHTMPAQMFRQLADNITNRGALESLPFCALTKKHIEIVSGHHRKRAASAAGLTHIIVLLDTSGLTRDQIRAKQLAHNSINGTDDPQIIKQIYDMIADAEAKIEAFIDPKALDIPKPDSIPITDLLGSDLDHRTMMFVFLHHQHENFEKVIELISKDVDEVGVADIIHFDKFRDTLKQVKDIENVRAVGMVISKMCDIVIEHYRELNQEKTDVTAEEPGREEEAAA